MSCHLLFALLHVYSTSLLLAIELFFGELRSDEYGTSVIRLGATSWSLYPAIPQNEPSLSHTHCMLKQLLSFLFSNIHFLHLGLDSLKTK